MFPDALAALTGLVFLIALFFVVTDAFIHSSHGNTWIYRQWNGLGEIQKVFQITVYIAFMWSVSDSDEMRNFRKRSLKNKAITVIQTDKEPDRRE